MVDLTNIKYWKKRKLGTETFRKNTGQTSARAVLPKKLLFPLGPNDRVPDYKVRAEFYTSDGDSPNASSTKPLSSTEVEHDVASGFGA